MNSEEPNQEEPLDNETSSIQENSTEKEFESDIVDSLPEEDFEIIQMQKSGSITIPKHIRETFKDQPSFAFWIEDNRFIFQKLTPSQLEFLNQQKEEAKQKSKTSGRKKKEVSAEKKKNSKRKKSKKEEPELTKYFPFQFDNQDKITQILESTFYILFESPPKISEAIDRLKYGIIKFTTGNKTNDARLKHSYILFISDVLQRNSEESLNALIDFTYTKLLPSIQSRFLQEQARIELFMITIRRKQIELSHQLLHEILHGIELYKENYAIMQGFKNLVKPIQEDEIYIDPELKQTIYNKIVQFIKGFDVFEGDEEKPIIIHPKLSSDKALELIELLIDLQLIEEAYNQTKQLLNELSPEDIYIDQVRKMLSELKKMEL